MRREDMDNTERKESLPRAGHQTNFFPVSVLFPRVVCLGGKVIAGEAILGIVFRDLAVNRTNLQDGP